MRTPMWSVLAGAGTLVASAGLAAAQADPAIAYIAKYTSRGRAFWDVTVVDADGSDRKVVWSRTGWVYDLAWSPDLDGNPANGYRGTLAIAADEPGTFNTKMWLLDVVVVGGVAQGANPRVLVDDSDPLGQYLNGPCWSPDLDPLSAGYQGRIAFSGGMSGEIYTINLISMAWDGATAQPVSGPNSSVPLFSSPNAGIGSSTWSPEGTRLAVKQGGVGFRVLDPASGAVLSTIPTGFSTSNDCDWQRTPGSSVIALWGNDRLHTMDVDLGAPSLTPQPGAACVNRHPAWSPDDRYIAFSGIDCGNKKNFTIRRTDTLTGVVTTLSAEAGKDLMMPDWRRF